ncbi:hypothetical protein McpSp1_10370 [Methanocorpusculaceae archaeon Sp1]|uniref:Uncharacterized protein n=1 Tax=Methanorbis furvi TaxID=3028299 RepID=A0AAE4SA14_9EURY|nr:hypothetical protein [Methanocorpusculaceae archaeon Sp1]MDV0442412.1 hypothetical protein [Methanocorpusculaceae archaeon Ag1]
MKNVDRESGNWELWGKETANPRKSRSLRSLRKSRLLIVALIPPDSGGLVAIATAPANAGRRHSGAAIVEDVDPKCIEIIQLPQTAPDWRRPVFAAAVAIATPLLPAPADGEQRFANAICGASEASEICVDLRFFFPRGHACHFPDQHFS